MEVIIFCVTITTLAVFGMFGLGIAIGREVGKHERMDKTKLRGGDSRSDLRNDSIHGDRSGIFGGKGEVPIRRDNRQNLGEMETEEMKEMLRILIQLIERIETL